MAQAKQQHTPVMLAEVLQYLCPQNGETYVDATFGFGGYSEAILEAVNCKVIAIDRDPNVRIRANEIKNRFGDRFEFRLGQFSHFSSLIEEKINGAVFDVGVSSMQFDEANRGFSFQQDGSLDMRMSCEGLSAADIINTYTEKDLADLIYVYGEEKKSRQIARKIVEARQHKAIQTTTELADIVRSVVYHSDRCQ